MKHSITYCYLLCGVFILSHFTVWKVYVLYSNRLVDKEIKDILVEIRLQKRILESDRIFTIGMRLEEAEKNWKRGLKYRGRLEDEKLVDLDAPWNFINGISIWDFFYPNFDCPHTVERIGKSGDGGKWICGFGHLSKKTEPCIVYSYGVNKDTSFEDEIIARTNCSVFMFDHTIDTTEVALPKLHPDRVLIEKMGIGVNDTTNLRSVKSTMKKYNHDFIDILKVDVEGAEFAVFDNFKKDFPAGLPFGQLSIEIHLPIRINKELFLKYKTWLTNLEDMGLRPFRNEFNLINIKRSPKHYPRLCEYSFVNVKYDNYLLH